MGIGFRRSVLLACHLGMKTVAKIEDHAIFYALMVAVDDVSRELDIRHPLRLLPQNRYLRSIRLLLNQDAFLDDDAVAVRFQKLMGEPFPSCFSMMPEDVSRRFPVAAREMAETIYDLAPSLPSSGGVPALADLLDLVGAVDMADHLRDVPVHPRGCWVLDVLTGR